MQADLALHAALASPPHAAPAAQLRDISALDIIHSAYPPQPSPLDAHTQVLVQLVHGNYSREGKATL